jgi:hypothetical protein
METQQELLRVQLSEACRLYNAALDERRSAWRMRGISLGYYDQANQLKAIRAAADIGVANFSACQDVLRRDGEVLAVDALSAALRRVPAEVRAGLLAGASALLAAAPSHDRKDAL